MNETSVGIRQESGIDTQSLPFSDALPRASSPNGSDFPTTGMSAPARA
jgi:hypothetical protein